MITYIARNTKNGKFYIGSTTNFERRKREHLISKENYPFQTALRKNPELFEWETVEDDSDERILEQALLDMWYGKKLCYNLSPRADAPLINYERNYHNGILVREMKLGFHNPDYRNSDEYKQMQIRSGKRVAELGIGIHSEEFRTTKLKELGKINGKKIGKFCYQNQKGIFDPNYQNSQKFIDDNEKRIERAKEVCSIEIKLIDPNGNEFIFYSMQEAERKLGIPNQTISKVVRRGGVITKGKWEGWRAISTQ